MLEGTYIWREGEEEGFERESQCEGRGETRRRRRRRRRRIEEGEKKESWESQCEGRGEGEGEGEEGGEHHPATNYAHCKQIINYKADITHTTRTFTSHTHHYTRLL